MMNNIDIVAITGVSIIKDYNLPKIEIHPIKVKHYEIVDDKTIKVSPHLYERLKKECVSYDK